MLLEWNGHSVLCQCLSASEKRSGLSHGMTTRARRQHPWYCRSKQRDQCVSCAWYILRPGRLLSWDHQSGEKSRETIRRYQTILHDAQDTYFTTLAVGVTIATHERPFQCGWNLGRVSKHARNFGKDGILFFLSVGIQILVGGQNGHLGTRNASRGWLRRQSIEGRQYTPPSSCSRSSLPHSPPSPPSPHPLYVND
jgi:hypothetical protein